MFEISAGVLYWDIFISIIGMGFFIYGKKRPDMVALVAGLVLMFYPYFISSLGWDIGIGIAILAFYIILKRVF